MIPKKVFCDDKDHVYVVIETPKGSRNKCDYIESGDFFELAKILPAGCAFPLDFGFIPETKCEDGDPIDVLVLSDSPAYMGMVIKCRVIAIMEATQKEPGKKIERNDRLIAVALNSRDHSNLIDSKDINPNLLDELVNFFKYYNKMCGKKFKMLAIKNSATALKAVKKSIIKPE